MVEHSTLHRYADAFGVSDIDIDRIILLWIMRTAVQYVLYD